VIRHCGFLVLLLGCDGKDTILDTSAVDEDGDGFDLSEDCDDGDSARNPDATEVCDGIDNNCDGVIDEGLKLTWYADADGDGFGSEADTLEACEPPSGYVTAAGDCDDTAGSVHPMATEVCDRIDNDCSGEVDDLEGAEFSDWYRDADEDGHGVANDVVNHCEQPLGYTALDDDCDDADPSVYPGAPETWYDGIDSDCDGADDMDRDGDGHPGGDDGTDCDDADATTYPGALDPCDGVDSDCDGVQETSLTEDFDTQVDPAHISLNGTATQVWNGSDGALRLTEATGGQRGTAFFLNRMPSQVFEANFTLEVAGGSGADGMSFAILEETDPTSIGVSGGGLGVRGLSGYAVEFDTYTNSSVGDLTSDHVAFIETVEMGFYEQQAATFREVGEIAVEVTMVAGAFTVDMDGVEVLSGFTADFDLVDAMFGFTGSTGGVNDEHWVDDVVICTR